MNTEEIKNRLDYLRGELRAERISYGELAELQSLSEHIEDGDTELLEAAGVREFAMKRNQMWDLAFTVITDKAQPTKDEMLEAMQKRVDYLKENPDDIFEACGLCDEYETE